MMSQKRLGVLLMAGLMLMAPAYAKKTIKPVSAHYISANQYDDRIVAHVGENFIITQRQLNRYIRVRQTLGVLSVHTVQEALEQYINELLILNFANRSGISVSTALLNGMLQQVASSNGMTVERFFQQLQSKGVSVEEYMDYLKTGRTLQEVKQSLFQYKINITEHDVDVFLKQHPRGVIHRVYKPIRQEIVQPVFITKAVALRDIVLPLSIHATQEEANAVKAQAEAIRQQILSGAQFEDMAKRFSKGETAGDGGNLGIRLVEDWPIVFVNAIANVPDKGVTKVFRAPNGYHIVQVVERRGIVEQRKRVVVISPKDQMSPLERLALSGDTIVSNEVNTRHILVKFSPVVDDKKAQSKINQIYALLNQGEPFEKVAKKYSEDTSAAEGGQLGWIDVTSLEPVYAKMSLNLPLHQVSEPFKTQFGWHILEVLDRKEVDKTQSIYRGLAKEALFNDRAESVFRDWVSELRTQTYIETHLGR